MSQKTLISGQFRDRQGNIYNLQFEPAISLGDGEYIIQRQHSIVVYRVIN